MVSAKSVNLVMYETVSPGGTKTTSFHRTASVTLRNDGQHKIFTGESRCFYENFKKLMDTFEKSMRLFSIQAVSFTAPEKDGDLTSYDVKLQTYYIK